MAKQTAVQKSTIEENTKHEQVTVMETVEEVKESIGNTIEDNTPEVKENNNSISTPEKENTIKENNTPHFSINILPYLPHYSTHHSTLTVLFNTKYYMFYTLPYFFLLFMFNQSLYLFYMYLQHSPYISPIIFLI